MQKNIRDQERRRSLPYYYYYYSCPNSAVDQHYSYHYYYTLHPWGLDGMDMQHDMRRRDENPYSRACL